VQGAFRIGYWVVSESPLDHQQGVPVTPDTSGPSLVRAVSTVLAATLAAAPLAALPLAPTVLAAQSPPVPRPAADTPPEYVRPAHYWRSMAAGFAASLLAHEGAHVVTAIAVGGRPTLGLSKGRPTVYSGLDANVQQREQFLFSSMGLNVQALIDEAILDVPHARGGAFERGVLAGGIATALFYVTIGRTASVSDVDFMARTSSLSKTDITLIYGGVAVMHLVRIRRDSRYAHFFVRPMPAGERGLRVGMDIR
jgi:hypothetical protein